MKMPQTPEDPEQLWGLPRLLTQRTGPGVDVSDFRRRLALGGDQGETQRELQVQLALGALRGLRQGREHLQPLREVAHGFHRRRARAGPLAGALPVVDTRRAAA